MRLTGKVSGRGDSGEYGPPHHKEVDSYAQRNCTTTETMRVEPLAGALTKRQKYDYRDIDRRELKLIRVGQAIFALYKRERRFPGSTGVQQKALLEACETCPSPKCYAARIPLKSAIFKKMKLRAH